MQLRIDWAEKHIGDLHGVVREFIKTELYGITCKIDAKTRELVYYVIKADDPPPEVPLIIGDILQNLRAALDYLVCALGGRGFPIFKNVHTSPEYQPFFERQVKGVRQEVFDYIASTNPYKGGDTILWRLHELNIRDKHRLLFTVGALIWAFNAGQHLRATAPRSIPGAAAVADKLTDHWVGMKNQRFPLQVGTEIFRDFPDAKINKDIKFMSQIAFNEVGVCEGELIIAVLKTSLNRVRLIAKELAPFR